MDVCTDVSRETNKERRRRNKPGQLNCCNELEAKSIRFVLLATRYVECLNYLCCFSQSHINEQFSNFATEVKNSIRSAYTCAIPEDTET